MSRKCTACGYEHEEEWDTKAKVYTTTIGDEKFLAIETMARIKPEHSWDHSRDCYMYACPKCGTVKVEV